MKAAARASPPWPAPLGLASQAATWPWKSLMPTVVARIAALHWGRRDVVEHPRSARGTLLVAAGIAFVLAAGLARAARGRSLPPDALRLPALLLAIALAVGWPAFAQRAQRRAPPLVAVLVAERRRRHRAVRIPTRRRASSTALPATTGSISRSRPSRASRPSA